MQNTLAYILKNYSYKPSDSHNILNNETLFQYLIILRKTRNWSAIQHYTKYYFPYVLQQYLGTDKYTITLDNGKQVNIPIKYSLFDLNKKVVDHARFNFTPNLTIFYITLYPSILSFTDRTIDAIIAHELAHAKRIWSGITKLPINTIKKTKHEEFWADRELKKSLVLVNPKYNSKSERRKTLKILHKEDNLRWKATGFFQTKTGELWDELFPFSNNSIIYYTPYQVIF